MFRRPLRPGLCFDAYRSALARVVLLKNCRFAGLGALACLLRSQGYDGRHSSDLLVVQRVAAVLTDRQRRAPGRGGWPEPEFLAAAAGVPLDGIERFLEGFDRAERTNDEFLRAGFAGRLAMLARADPILQSWSRRWPRKGP